uniref:Uncharacterized protein n=1 Tax=Tetranychus urticae TaxID=32264 RepID=T1K4L9_TETUR
MVFGLTLHSTCPVPEPEKRREKRKRRSKEVERKRRNETKERAKEPTCEQEKTFKLLNIFYPKICLHMSMDIFKCTQDLCNFPFLTHAHSLCPL